MPIGDFYCPRCDVCYWELEANLVDGYWQHDCARYERECADAEKRCDSSK